MTGWPEESTTCSLAHSARAELTDCIGSGFVCPCPLRPWPTQASAWTTHSARMESPHPVGVRRLAQLASTTPQCYSAANSLAPRTAQDDAPQKRSAAPFPANTPQKSRGSAPDPAPGSLLRIFLPLRFVRGSLQSRFSIRFRRYSVHAPLPGSISLGRRASFCSSRFGRVHHGTICR